MESFKAQFRARELPETPAAALDRAARFFDYLRGQHAIRDVPVRDVAVYDERRWWESDLPDHTACRLRPEPGGPWLSVNKVPIPVPPNPPAKLDAVLDRQFGDPGARPRFVEGWVAKFGLDDETVDELEARLRIWLTDEWEPWAERARHANTARSLYQDLFDLYLRLLRQDAEFELLWGHGFLTWKPGGEAVRFPIVLTPCSVRFNGDSGQIEVVPDGPSAMQFGFLKGMTDWLGVDQSHLADLSRRFAEDAPDPWGDSIAKWYRDFFAAIGQQEGSIDAGDPAVPTGTPSITTRSLLFVRRRVPGFTLFFERMRELVVDGYPVPPPVRAIIGEVEREGDSVEETGNGSDGARADWSAISSRLLMPLPSNAEQDEIARKLADHDAITVQGPPGTGKSHTIANLTAHLLAHGRRVLVTSYKQQPLEILREMIPEDIRPLCVSVLGSSAHALEQLERSVQSIHENAGSLDRAKARARVVEVDGELERHIDEAEEARRRLEAIDRREGLVYILGDRDVNPSELAQWVVENKERHGHIPDVLSDDDECPLTRGEVARYFELCAELEPEDRKEGIRHLPDWRAIPDGPALSRKIENLHNLHERISAAQGRLTTWEMVDATPLGDLQELALEVSRTRENLLEMGAAWLEVIRFEVAGNPEWLDHWLRFVASIRDGVREIASLRAGLAGHEVTLPESDTLHAHGNALEEALEELRRRVTDGRKFRMRVSRELRELRERCVTDGHHPESIEDYDLLLLTLRIERKRHELRNRWNHEILRVGGVQPGIREEFPEQVIGTAVEQMAAVLDWERAIRPELQSRLGALGMYIPDRCAPEDLDSVLVAIDAVFARREYLDGMGELEELAEDLKVESSYEESSPLFAELTQALSAYDPAAWQEAYTEVVRLDGLRLLVFEADELARRMSGVAPVWASRIASERGDVSVCGDPRDVEAMWQWRQAETWLSHLMEADDPVQLQARLEESLEGIVTCTRELASLSAWLYVANNMTDTRRRSLAVWAQALRRARDSEGATLAAWRAEAEAAMQDSVEAIPAWIMPLYRVVEVFDPATEPFDVVIIDESSQCDLFSVAALALAKKAVVVGDDMQMSPQTLVIDEANVRGEIQRLIPDVPNASLLEPQSSLYEIAKRSYSGSVMLREHFRCLPEIVSFSNDLAYHGRILPLREKHPDPAWEPIMTRHVPEGFRLTGSNRNPEEAAEIVDLIARLCSDPAYEGKTMGVVSLLGDEQAHTIEEALIFRLGEVEMNRRKLRCGDPYQFQGDERDVIFVSMVVARDDDGLTNRPFIEDHDRQSVNVAASRARDQMWLVHSVGADQLHPHDVRGQLIRFCTEGDHKRLSDFSSSTRMSELDAELAAEVEARGYDVVAHHPVGRVTIDLLVSGEGGRLAVEVAGPSNGTAGWAEDRHRREVLERLGWRFHHVRGSEFRMYRQETLRKLWDRLDHLGIQPVH